MSFNTVEETAHGFTGEETEHDPMTIKSSENRLGGLKYRQVATRVVKQGSFSGNSSLNGKVGIVGYGVSIPRERIETATIVRERERKRGKELEKVLEKVRHGLLLREKAVAGHTEDTMTIATEAAENAIRMAGISPGEIGGVTAGSESKPYAVGTIARHVASFVGVGENVFIADLEGACNSGMQGVSFIDAEIRSGRIRYGLARSEERRVGKECRCRWGPSE